MSRRAGELVASLHLIEVSDGVLETAARLEPSALRSLDAIHLASALALGMDLGSLVTYDHAMAAAAKSALASRPWLQPEGRGRRAPNGQQSLVSGGF